METGREAFGIKSLNRHILEQIVAASSAGVLVADASQPELLIVYANAAYERLTGYALADLAGHPWAALARAADGDAFATVRAALGRGEACRATIPDVRKDGTTVTWDISVTPLHGPRGDLRYFLLTHQAAEQPQDELPNASAEITVLQSELGRARQKIAALDRIDPGTGLVRFPYFQETLRRDLAMARRDRRYVTLLVFQIVEYGVYRQTFGDKAADSCQRMIGAQIMRALRRAGDLCARYDERTLVAAAIGHPSEIQPLVDRIAESVRQLRLHNPRAKTSRYIEIQPIVIGCPPGAHDDPEPLIARALTEPQANGLAAQAG
jgi:PAS domain S-box-containing protein